MPGPAADGGITWEQLEHARRQLDRARARAGADQPSWTEPEDAIARWWRDRGRPALRLTAAGAADLGRAVRDAVPDRAQLRTTWEQITGAVGAVPVPSIELPRLGRPDGRLVRVLALTLAVALVAIPVTGHSEEAIATVGQRLFAVPPIPDEPLAVPAERSVVLDSRGNVLATLTGPENRQLVSIDRVPQVLRDAVIATEDARFLEHDGIDTRGIVRAAWANVTAGEVEQGGSTITQQYVKNALLTSERSLGRKVTEAVWAVQLERQSDKDEILEAYLNIVYLGGGTYGVAAASEYWFGMSVDKLDLPRAALLASMIRAPSNLDLVGDPESARPGRDAVLREMLEAELITRDRADQAAATTIAELLAISPLPAPQQPMFVRHVVDVLLDQPGLGETREERRDKVFGGGLTIHTTIDPHAQQAAVAAIAENVTDPTIEPMAGIVSVQPGDGAIRAMALGPHGWGPCDDLPEGEPCRTTTVNPLVSGMGSPGRQVGSAFKPIVLAAAMEAGVPTSWHTTTDGGKAVPGCPEDWEPENYSGTSGGTMDAVEAMRRSNNVFHVKLGVALGLERVTETASRLGLGELPPYCSLPLGSVELHPVDLAAAYAALAARGYWCQPYAITQVSDREGEVLLRHERDCAAAIHPDTAAAVTTVLQENAERGTATRAQIGRPIAAKTGTTNDFRDAWLVGYTPQLATAVWLGYEIPTPMTGILGWDRVSGGSVPAELWGRYMAVAMEPYEVVPLPEVPLARWNGSCSQDRDDFEPGEQRCPKREKKNDDRRERRRDRDDD